MDIYTILIILCYIGLFIGFLVLYIKQWMYVKVLEKNCEEMSDRLDNTEYKFGKFLNSEYRKYVNDILDSFDPNTEMHEYSQVMSRNLKALATVEFKDLYDGSVTMEDQMDRIAIMFAIMTLIFKDTAWISDNDYNGQPMPRGRFSCGFRTSAGNISYNFPSKYYDLFGHVKQVEIAPVLDGASSKEKMIRLWETFFVKEDIYAKY